VRQDQPWTLQNELVLAAALEPLLKHARAAEQQQQQQARPLSIAAAVAAGAVAAAVEQAALSMQPPSIRLPQQQQQQQGSWLLPGLSPHGLSSSTSVSLQQRALLAAGLFANAAAALFAGLPAAAAAGAGVELQGSGMLLSPEGLSVSGSWGIPPQGSVDVPLQQQQQPNAFGFPGSTAAAAADEPLDIDPNAPDLLAHLVIPPKRKRGRPRKRPLEPPAPPPPQAAAAAPAITATAEAAASQEAAAAAAADAAGGPSGSKRAKATGAAAAQPAAAEEQLGAIPALAAMLQQHGYPSIKPSLS
jgi:hypothetical protein